MAYTGKMFGNTVPPVKTGSTLASLDITYPLHYITATDATALSLSSDMEEGLILTVILNNSGASGITLSLPNSGKFISLDGASLKVKAGGYGEISILCFRNPTDSPCYIISSKS